MLQRSLDTTSPGIPSVPPQIPRRRSETPSAAFATLMNDSEYSLVNERMIMKGDLESDADILVKGKVYGNIRCKMLIVDSSACVEGSIEADDVVVRGSTKGTILARRVRLEKTADVASDIHHASFCAEEGARIRGALAYSDDPRSHAPNPATATQNEPPDA